MDSLVEVAFATVDKQLIIPVRLPDNSTLTIQQVINESGILQKIPEIDLAKMSVGIFSQICHLEKIVEDGDRVEIYRSLQQNPMDARRKRAIKR